MCSETGFHPAYFVKHLRDKHLKKFSIKLNRLSKEKIESWTKRPYDPTAKVTVEISDSSEDEDSPEKAQPEPPVKKARMGPASFMKRNSQESVAINIDDDEEEEEKKKIETVEDSVVTLDKSSKDEDLKSSKMDVDVDGETKKANDVAVKADENKGKDEKEDVKDEKEDDDDDDEKDDEKDDKEGSGEDSKSPKPSKKVEDDKDGDNISNGDAAKASPAKRKMGPASFMAKRQKLD